jgi:hypothetical protein
MASGQINLRDMAQGMGESVAAGITLNFARRSVMMDKLPFENVDTFWVRKWLADSFSEANFRQFGSAFTTVKDNLRDAQDSLSLLGGQIDIDMALKEAGQQEQDLFAYNVNAQADRFRYTFMDRFVNGNKVTDTEAFNGLSERVDQFVADGHTDAKIDGANADLSASSAVRQTFLDNLSDGLERIDAGESADDIGASVILTGREGYLSIASIARREGLLDTSKDSFDRTIDSFMGVPILRAGTKADQSTSIITATETDDGTATTGADNTSFYIMKLGGDHVHGMQMGSPETPLDRLIDDGVTHRVVFQWKVGIGAWNKRSVVRYYGVDPLFN